MKKLIIIILCILMILLAGAPFLFGIKAEQNYTQFINKLGATETVRVEDRNYQRGYFSSSSKTILSTNNGSKTIRIYINDKINHGPYDYTKITSGNLDFKPFLANAHSDITTDIPVTSSEGNEKIISINMSGDTVIDINQELNSRITIPKYKFIKSKENITAEWSGLELDMQYNIKTDYFTSTLNSKHLSIDSKDIEFSIKNLKGSSKAIGHKDKLSSMTGDYQIKIDEINFSSPSDKMNIQNIKLSGYSKKDIEKLNSGLKFVADKINVNNDNFGSFNTELSINNLDFKAYSRLHRLSQSTRTNTGTENGAEDIMDILPELFKHSPSIDLQYLDLTSSIGNLKADASIKINGDNPKLLQNIFLIGTAVEAEANITISSNLANYISSHGSDNNIMENKSTQDGNAANNAGLKIQQLLDSNILKTDGSNYVLKAKLSKGNLTVNDQPMAVNPMLFNPN